MDVGETAEKDAGDMAEDVKAVEIRAELRQVKSMADHTFNIVLNVPEYCLPQVQELMGWLLDEVAVVMVRQTESDQN